MTKKGKNRFFTVSAILGALANFTVYVSSFPSVHTGAHATTHRVPGIPVIPILVKLHLAYHIIHRYAGNIGARHALSHMLIHQRQHVGVHESAHMVNHVPLRVF
ncbi:MAG: hypothetical protein M0Z56_02885, partial [Desulfobacteraceae bacterium]|nr:hypothetical protein [Desulfobacteraceae bacterium]